MSSINWSFFPTPPTEVTLKFFIDNITKYLTISNHVRLRFTDSIYIMNPRIEDCETHYLLSDFTVVNSYIPFPVDDHNDIILLNEKLNVKIKMNKNKTSNTYYNNRYTTTYNCIMVSLDLQYYKGHPYYPVSCKKMESTRSENRIYLTELKRLVDAEEWDRYESRYYHLVNPELTPEKIQEIREEKLREAQAEQRRLAEERRQAEQKIQLAQEKINDEVEKEDLDNIYALYNDIKDGKIKNMPNSMKKILLSYIANVSENIQFHLQKEIKEIYKELKNINDELELYVHNI